MLKDSFSHAGDDAFRRALREAQVEAQRLIEATQSALENDAVLLSTLERAHIDEAMTKLQTMMIGDDRRAIDQAMQTLSAATNEFAARRMNQSVKRALAGRKIDQLSL
jgi:molecular chaperone HscA